MPDAKTMTTPPRKAQAMGQDVDFGQGGSRSLPADRVDRGRGGGPAYDPFDGSKAPSGPKPDGGKFSKY